MTAANCRQMSPLLTKGEREFLRGESGAENPDDYLNTIRYRVRKRIAQIEDDLGLLEEAGEDEVLQEFDERFGGLADDDVALLVVLRNEVGELRTDIDALHDEVDSIREMAEECRQYHRDGDGDGDEDRNDD